MHPKNPRGKIADIRTDTVDPCEHDPGERFVIVCATCESEEMGEIEDFGEGVCWRCDECGGAMDISVTAPTRIPGNSY